MKNDSQVKQYFAKGTLLPEEEVVEFWADCLFSALEDNSLVYKIFREVYGSASPGEELCPLSFVTKNDLERCKEVLGLQPRMTLLDLACGSGGPGLWLARESGANLIGVDISIRALEQAAQRAIRFGIAERVKYLHGSMKTTGLDSDSFDAVVSIDALWMASDKRAVLQEVRRLLHSQGQFVFTAWDSRIPGTHHPTSDEFRSMLQDAGFQIQIYDETLNWEVLQRGVYTQYLLRQKELEAEMGVSAAGILVSEATGLTTTLADGTDRLSKNRRIFVATQAV